MDPDPLRPTLNRPEPDRTRPDPEMKRIVEREFLRQKRYPLVDSPEQADFVFFVEGKYYPSMLGPAFRIRRGAMPAALYKFQFTDHLETGFAIAVPASAYEQNPHNAAALLAAKFWEGSATLQYGISRGSERLVMNTVGGDLVKQFHGKAKRPPFHTSLCLPANPFASQSSAISPKTVPILSTEAAGVTLNEAQTDRSDDAVKVDVALVTVPVAVIGSDGYHVRGLDSSDFQLYEDGVRQRIDRIIPSDDPISLSLALDTFDRNEFRLKDLQGTALAFAETLRGADRAMVVSFDQEIHQESYYSSDRGVLRRAIQQIKGTICCSRLYDAIDLIFTERMNRITGRKAIVLFTYGEDTCSRLVSADQVLARMEESGLPAFIVQYETKSCPKSSTDFLVQLATRSGGRHSRANSIPNIVKAFSRIADDLHGYYTLCY